MPRLILAFFISAALYGVAGMAGGAHMGSIEDFSMAPAHAHLNLLGWVTLSLMGSFYAIAGHQAPVRLGWANFAISNVGLWMLLASLPRLLVGDKSANPLVIAGSAITIAGVLSFAAAVVSLWVKPGVAKAGAAA